MSTYAFIDAQNVNQAIQGQGWRYDLRKLRVYLADKYGVTKAYFFIGFVSRNQSLYDHIQNAGFILQFKEVAVLRSGEIKGNIDANLTLFAAKKIADYDKAVLVSAGGDFSPLVQYWKDEDKFKAILSPATQNRTSQFLKRDAQGYINFMPDIKNKLER